MASRNQVGKMVSVWIKKMCAKITTDISLLERNAVGVDGIGGINENS